MIDCRRSVFYLVCEQHLAEIKVLNKRLGAYQPTMEPNEFCDASECPLKNEWEFYPGIR